MEQAKVTRKGNRIAAWAVILFLVLFAAVTLANQLLELLVTLGWMKGR